MSRINIASGMNRRAALWHHGRAATKDALGQYPIADEKLCEFWCEVIPQTGSLLSGRAADTALSRTTHKIIRRMPAAGDASLAAAAPEMWLIIDGVRYEILYVQPGYPVRNTQEIFAEVRCDGDGRV